MHRNKFFFENLLKWNRDINTRQMPWKGISDPYKIWISEIILQQTRVQQGLSYYNKFIEQWPNIKNLASAPDQKIYKAWEGLGYYSRCKNLIDTARYIANDLDGNFPNSYNEILSLKGIGSYTAAAIASFAYKLPYAVIDGNVIRVLSRFFGISAPSDTQNGKKIFTNLAQDLLDKERPDIYNQAIMDFGAVICKPLQPLCNDCVLQKKCFAYKHSQVNTLPLKEKKVRISNRYFNYFIISHRKKVFIRRREQKDIWQNLYEFALIESDKLIPKNKFLNSALVASLIGKEFVVKNSSDIFQQKLTHQIIEGRFFHVDLKKVPLSLKNFIKVSYEELKILPFPKFINAYIKDKMYL